MNAELPSGLGKALSEAKGFAAFLAKMLSSLAGAEDLLVREKGESESWLNMLPEGREGAFEEEDVAVVGCFDDANGEDDAAETNGF